MCYIFNCFGWTLDLLQRLITFFLACFVLMVVCIGLVVGAGTGIAYGYNYFLAEYLTLHAPADPTKTKLRVMEMKLDEPYVLMNEGKATDSRMFSTNGNKSAKNISEFTPKQWWEAGHTVTGSRTMKSQHNNFMTSKKVESSVSFIIDSTIWPNADSPVIMRHFIRKLIPKKEGIVSTKSNIPVKENNKIGVELQDDKGNVDDKFRKTIDIADSVPKSGLYRPTLQEPSKETTKESTVSSSTVEGTSWPDDNTDDPHDAQNVLPV